MNLKQWLGALSAVALAAGPVAADDAAKSGSQGGMHEDSGKYGEGADEGAYGTGERSGKERKGQDSMGAGQTGAQASNQLQGKISEYDQQARTLKLEAEGQGETELRLTENATVFIDGRLGTSADLQEGQEVRAAFDEREGSKTVRWIEVTTEGGGAQQQPMDGSQEQGSMGAGEEGSLGAGQQGTAPGSKPGTMPQHGTMQGGTMQGGTMPGQQGAMQGTQPQNQLTGRVVSVDAEKNQLVLDHQGQQVTIDLRENTPVFIQGRRSSLSGIQEGQQIRAALEPAKGAQAGARTALRIETMPSATGDQKGTEHKGMDHKEMPHGGTGTGTQPMTP